MRGTQTIIMASTNGARWSAVCQRCCLYLIALTVSGFSSAAPFPEVRRPLDFSSFRIIPERNIFNGNRSGRVQIRTEDQARPPSRVEAFTLVGTLSYGKGPFAFFNGTSSDYRKVLQPGETIAGYRVSDISAGQVKLQAETNCVELRVGTQLRRENEGAWQLREDTEGYVGATSRSEFRSYDSRRGDSRGDDSWRGDSRRGGSRDFESRGMTSSNPASSASSAGSTPNLSSAEESEILKRLMEQREKELK